MSLPTHPANQHDPTADQHDPTTEEHPMATAPFTASDLMDLLVRSVGLPSSARTDDTSATLSDLGLDSLAVLQLQTELQQRYGVEPGESTRAEDAVVGELVASVNEAAASGASA
ncbi:acyl carrier protein [Quadrisphaera sp. DSM 44207]|uniref:acyl carrier protein n=1 Tax=Quadrisphaera sp. DSM 44207 TaxID=1881057 RepID=UPI0008841FB0|nr:acyl carrier protein [Quadrisphaera sp. DSM 44207]SDQ09875.1 Acyl carrier protein [Quadrisphaera sp. DSM 44207]